MSDNDMSLVPDVFKSTSDAVQANIPETAKQTDGVLATVVGFFNHVVLHSVKMANLTFQYKLEAFEDDLKKKTQGIPNENLQIPPIMIAGPILEALRYTYDEEDLREMYENLLASAMDNRTASQAHPAFTHAIRQMDPLDAKVLAVIAQNIQLRCSEITFSLKNKAKSYVFAMPNYFVVELLDLGDPFEISASIENLKRLSLIDVVDWYMEDTNYIELIMHPYVLSRKAHYESYGEEIEVIHRKMAILVNDYGRNFVQTCLDIHYDSE